MDTDFYIIGELYKGPSFHFLIFHTLTEASLAMQTSNIPTDVSKNWAIMSPEEWARELVKLFPSKFPNKIMYSEAGETFLILGIEKVNNEILLHVLYKDKQGWIVPINQCIFNKLSNNKVGKI